MDVLSLLRSKNRCLEKFLEASSGFLAQARSSGRLPDLPSFEARREAILRAIDLYDRKVSEAVALLPPGPRPQELVKAVEASLKEKDVVVHRILAVDEQILLLVEEEKNKVLKEMASNQKRTTLTQKFKSTWLPEAGEEIDKKL
jgi:hypothetical protein